MTCAERLLGCEVDRTAGIVHFEGREVSVQVHPIGIDVPAVERLAARAGPPRVSPERVRHVVGVDRLDYTKGIHERLLAVERLLETHPEYHRRVIFTQVLVSSRERLPDYSRLKREIDEAVGRINGRFSEKGWAPVRYMVRSLPPEELVAHYRRSDVALVTPLRDGMNLVAKEYAAALAAQDPSPDDPNYDAMTLPALQALAATDDYKIDIAPDGKPLSKGALLTAIKAKRKPTA